MLPFVQHELCENPNKNQVKISLYTELLFTIAKICFSNLFTSRKRHSSVASCLATRSWSQHCGTGATRYSLNNSNATFQRSDNPPSFPCVARLLAVLPHATLCLTKLLPLALRVNKFPPTRLLATFAFGDEYVFAMPIPAPSLMRIIPCHVERMRDISKISRNMRSLTYVRDDKIR